MAFSFFPASHKTKINSQPIPPEILKAVKIMNDVVESPAELPVPAEEKRTFKVTAALQEPASGVTEKLSASPFLEAAPVSTPTPPVADVVPPTPAPLPTPPPPPPVPSVSAPTPTPIPIPTPLRKEEKERVAAVVEAYPSTFQPGLHHQGLASPIPEAFAIEKLTLEPKNSHWIRGIFLAVFVLLLTGGVYWFFVINHGNVDFFSIERVIKVEPYVPPSQSQEKPPVVLPFSPDAPNYLSIDTETVTTEDIKNTLAQAGSRILEAAMTTPIEFVMTDKNNNPLAFSRLTFLAQVGLSAELLSTLDESFSLFLYNDGGMIRTGLMLTSSNPAQTAPLIQRQETALPFAFQGLLFNGVTVPRKVLFRGGAYGTQTVRYINIDLAKNYSFDYALKGNLWLIGTSKNTLRALLDKK